MTARLWCSPNVYLVRVEDDIVVLDLDADRYHCLVGGGDSVRLEDNGTITPVDDDTADELLAAGLAQRGPPATPRAAPTAPRREVTFAAQPLAADIVRAATTWVIAAAIFRGKPLSVLAAYHREMPGRDPASDAPRLANLVAAARRARPWIPFEGECLKRSFQLRCLLATHGIAADWIFGVRTWPFSAHCWLQIGDLVVGDRLERVQRYTPIMRA